MELGVKLGYLGVWLGGLEWQYRTVIPMNGHASRHINKLNSGHILQFCVLNAMCLVKI